METSNMRMCEQAIAGPQDTNLKQLFLDFMITNKKYGSKELQWSFSEK